MCANTASIRGRLGIMFVGAAPFVRQSDYDDRWSAGALIKLSPTTFSVASNNADHTAPGFVSGATNSTDAANRVQMNDLPAGIVYVGPIRSARLPEWNGSFSAQLPLELATCREVGR